MASAMRASNGFKWYKQVASSRFPHPTDLRIKFYKKGGETGKCAKRLRFPSWGISGCKSWVTLRWKSRPKSPPFGYGESRS